jgi:hypothetical protein
MNPTQRFYQVSKFCKKLCQIADFFWPIQPIPPNFGRFETIMYVHSKKIGEIYLELSFAPILSNRKKARLCKISAL